MKKKLTLGKTRMGLFALSLMMCCTIVVYAASHSKTSDFYSWKSTNLGGKLTAEDWDVLMEKLKYEAIPKGAIMAFNLSECPEGWTRYNNANGKMIRGLDIGQTPGTNGGSNSVRLVTDNLPQHNHYIRYGWQQDDNGDNNHGIPLVVDWNSATYPAGANIRGVTSDSKTQNLNNRKFTVKTAPYGENWGSQTSIDVTNLYVALLFCQKN